MYKLVPLPRFQNRATMTPAIQPTNKRKMAEAIAPNRPTPVIMDAFANLSTFDAPKRHKAERAVRIVLCTNLFSSPPVDPPHSHFNCLVDCRLLRHASHTRSARLGHESDASGLRDRAHTCDWHTGRLDAIADDCDQDRSSKGTRGAHGTIAAHSGHGQRVDAAAGSGMMQIMHRKSYRRIRPILHKSPRDCAN